jgi:carbamoyltransferase
MQEKMNLKIKFRESFRPFAPAVLEEDVEKYFKIKTNSPYMLLVANVQENIRKNISEDEKKLF